MTAPNPVPLGSLPRLLLLTDRHQLLAGRSLVDTVAACAERGLTHVVLRELDLPAVRREALAAALARTGVSVIAARAPLAAAAAVHLSAVQPWVDGPHGRSCHSRDEVTAAALGGAGWATLSPYAGSPSKPGYGPPLPPGSYAELPIPVFALGGIAPDTAAGARRAGAHGVAVMGAVMRANDPGAVVTALLEAAG